MVQISVACWQHKLCDRRDAIKMSPRESKVWSLFVKKDGFMATCTACHRDYSYRSSVSNLNKHWKKIHGKLSDLSDSSSDNSDGEQEKNDTNKKPMATWKFFEVLDSEKFEATCKVCDQVVSYESVSDLRKHVEDHGEVPKDSDEEYEPPSQQRHVVKYSRSSKRYSKLWKYFKIVDDKMAICLICHGMFNHASTITNLRRHLVRKHEIKVTQDDDDGKKVIVSANGQLYEVETGLSHDDNDDDKLPMEMDTIYLEDLDDPIDDEPPSSPKKKLPKLTFKRDSTEYRKLDHTKEQIHKDFKKEPSKKDFSRKPLKEQFQKYFKKEQFKKNSDTCSEYSEHPKPCTSSSTTSMGSIDSFGQYIVSLLKELPKSVSDKLQNDIVNQILSSKMTLHSQTMAAKYELRVTRNNEETEGNIPEPVSFTVIQTNEDSEKSNDVTVQE